MPLAETSGYFEVAGRQLYGTLFQPQAPAAAGLVIYDPFGEEKKCAFRLIVRLARAAARAGLAVLRFDLSGTGESGGDHAKATWMHWREDAVAAARLLKQQTGLEHCTAIGLRLGALLAVHAATEAPCDAVCLIEPVLTGDECLRDLERRQKIKAMMGGNNTADDAAALWQQGLPADFGGIDVGAQLAAELRQDSLIEQLRDVPTSCPLQVLRVSGGKSFPSTWDGLLERARATPPGGAEIIRDKPFWGQLEYYESPYVIDAAMAFLRAVSNVPATGPTVPGEIP